MRIEGIIQNCFYSLLPSFVLKIITRINRYYQNLLFAIRKAILICTEPNRFSEDSVSHFIYRSTACVCHGNDLNLISERAFESMRDKRLSELILCNIEVKQPYRYTYHYVLSNFEQQHFTWVSQILTQLSFFLSQVSSILKSKLIPYIFYFICDHC